MDLSLTTDFDSTLLSWDEDDGPSREEAQQQETEGSGSTSGSQTPFGGDSEHGLKQSFTTQAMKEGFSRLPSFPTSIGGFSSTSDQPNGQGNPDTDATSGQAVSTANLQNAYATQILFPLTGEIASTAVHLNGSTGFQQQQQQNLMVQYALTGQAAGAPFPSVSCSDRSQMDAVSCLSTTTGGNLSSSRHSVAAPQRRKAAVTGTTSVAAASAQPTPNQANGALPTTQLHPLGIQSSAVCPPLSSLTAPAPAPGAMQFNPYMFNPYSMMPANPQLYAAFQASQQQMAAQYAAAQASAAQVTAAQASAVQAQVNPPAPFLPPPQGKPAKKSRATAQKGKKASNKKDDAPPFLLFDAPCELRQNFMQSQRMLNLPVHHDGNSYHYGMTVNGFHPQLNVATDPIQPLSSNRSILPPGANNIKLLDSRHKKQKGAGKERNEREQKRAQKITELIEQIRMSMEDGGWKVEIKSKYHTLSMCADYVKHLIKSTEEKEEAVEKAKSDLEVKERKLEEDKALLEGRSDPESVTSSLTASTAGGGKGDSAQEDAKRVSDTSSGSKRKAEELERDSAANNIESKKAKAEESSADSSGADDGDSGNGSGPQGHNISIGKMSSSVSELTDSNRGSSDSGRGSSDSGGENAGRHESAAHKKHPRSSDDEESSDLPSSGSISSTAAVLRGAGSHHREHGHADVVIKKHSRHRKRLREERSSLDRKFVIDYEEVFLTSNLPQIIATPAGRIVAWNKFFLRASGLDQNAVQRLTIFSLVQPDKLANLFEMVAEALRQKPPSESSSTTSSSGQTTGESVPSSTEAADAKDAAPQPMEYTAMTLPCTSFLAASSALDSSGESDKADPLYMTVTLMQDDDVRKRCFHCVFTDCKGTDGKMGFITPELLAKLFAEPKAASEKLRPRTTGAAKSDAKMNKESEGMEIEVNSTVAVADGEEDSD